MDITKYRSSQDEIEIFYGKASIIHKFIVANADEYAYQFLGKNSCYAFSDLIYKDDLQTFLDAVEKLNEGNQSIIVRVKCYNDNYRCLCMKLEYNGRIVNGYRSFDINFSDTLSIQEKYIKNRCVSDKYRKLLSLIPMLYYEYSFSTNEIIIYRYRNLKSIIIYKSNLDTLKDYVISSDDFLDSVKKQFEQFYDNMIKGVDKFETNLPAEIFDKARRGIFLKIKTTVIYKEDSKEMVIGVINQSENSEKEVYYLSEAARDAGTGLLNKRAISEYAIEKISDYDKCLYLVMMDIDDFKKINDTYGHLFGDEVLTKVAEIIISVLSSRGTVGRFGGDEFLIVIENVCDEIDLRRILKTIYKHIMWAFGDAFENLKITASMGITKFPDDGTDYEKLFKKADKSLYIAKAKGKNRYIIYDEKKHGSIESNSYKYSLIGMNTVLNSEKRAGAVSDIILNLYKKGVDAILPSSTVIQAYFDVDGIAVYVGEELKRTYSLGKYNEEFVKINFFKNENYKQLFNENNVYVETNINRIKTEFEEIYEVYLKQEIAEFVQCVSYFKDRPQVVISFDVFSRPRKWSENDIEYLSILGKLFGEVVINNILNK